MSDFAACLLNKLEKLPDSPPLRYLQPRAPRSGESTTTPSPNALYDERLLDIPELRLENVKWIQGVVLPTDAGVNSMRKTASAAPSRRRLERIQDPLGSIWDTQSIAKITTDANYPVSAKHGSPPHAVRRSARIGQKAQNVSGSVKPSNAPSSTRSRRKGLPKSGEESNVNLMRRHLRSDALPAPKGVSSKAAKRRTSAQPHSHIQRLPSGAPPNNRVKVRQTRGGMKRTMTP
jgi:hypothetical protein